ncbi:MAG TPA: Npt1/Npt2 family nucleotide transporter [Polyangiaceae bacterium]|nr:Npt1/Npt2 family nucleotide transporter [Polyangiaceae bacterium]
MKRLRIVTRLIDLRAGESRITILSFLVLMLTSAGYTVLETARDALLVTRLPQRDFGIVYIVIAVCALPAATLLSRVARRWDPRTVLMSLLVLAALGSLVFTGLPPRRVVVVAFYATVGLISSAVFPQFWVLLGTSLTVGQSRRLIGPIASASVLGGVVGAATAAASVPYLPVRGLIAVGAGILVVGAGATFFVPRLPARRPVPGPRGANTPLATSMDAFREEPFLLRVAVLVAATTATALVIDYYFKSTIARTIPRADRGAFIARYYTVVNVVALVVQLFVGSAIVRNLGVATTMVVTPLIAVVGGVAAFVGGAFAGPVLVLKAADGSLRSSINRLTTELVYLPVSSSGRERAKPFIDGALSRIVQALTAGGLLAAGTTLVLSPRVFASIVVFFSLAWLVAAVTMRRHYLGQLRRSVVPTVTDDRSAFELDLPSAELVIESLGNDDPAVVVAAMDTLARRGRERLIPALVLRHPDEQVLRRALEIFAAGSSTRSDWHTLANALLEHSSDRVRIAAASSLAAQGKLDFERLDADTAPGVRGYAALHAALGGPHEDLLDDPRIAAAMGGDDAALTGLLAAVADADPSPRVARVLVALVDLAHAPCSVAWADLVARATIRHGELAMIPRLIERLTHWEGRESILGALIALGPPAFDQVAEALEDMSRPRRLRAHLPQTLGRFGTPDAAEKLLDRVETEPDGLVRYKALRALGRIVSDYGVGVDRERIERCVQVNLVTYFRLLGTRVALGVPPATTKQTPSSTFRLLAGLLDDKLRQSLERAFRLLKIAHPKEDLHRVYLACIGTDRRARANAAEFLDALLRRRREQALRELVRIVSDDLSAPAQVARAAAQLGFTPPRTHEEAVQVALADSDIKVAALAALYAVATGAEPLAVSVQKAREKRPSLGPVAQGIFQDALPVR